MEQFVRCLGYSINRSRENDFVGFRWFGEAAQFPNELQRRCPDLFVRSGRREVMQCFDVSTHVKSSFEIIA
jgi:hypothetical protein